MKLNYKIGSDNLLKMIPNDKRKVLKCNKCGMDKSVKYMGKDNKPYCNKCIMVVDYMSKKNSRGE